MLVGDWKIAEAAEGRIYRGGKCKKEKDTRPQESLGRALLDQSRGPCVLMTPYHRSTRCFRGAKQASHQGDYFYLAVVSLPQKLADSIQSGY